jgi:hypothetical protein
MRNLFDAYDPKVATADDADYEDVETRQRRQYGRLNWGAGFFGWLDCLAVAALLAGGAAVALNMLGRTDQAFPPAAAGTRTVGTLTVAAGFVVLLLAYFCGGYVAGRMSRFNGGRQGVALWLVGLLLTGAGLGAVLMTGASPSALAGHLPHLTPPSWAHGIGVLVVAATLLLSSLLAAMAGGAAGVRYHRKVDEAGFIG